MKKTLFININVFLFAFIISFLVNKNSYSKVKIEKFDGVIDWEKQSNYAEAIELVNIAKNINREKKRRKQLRDAGLSKEEISRIIKNERNANITGKIDNNNDTSINTKPNTEQLQNNDDTDNNIVNINKYNQNVKNESNINQNTSPSTGAVINPNLQNVNQQNLINTKSTFDKNNDTNNQTQNNKQPTSIAKIREVDLTIRPPIKHHNIYEYENNLEESNTYNNDFELSRMLRKAGDNINNHENFALYAKEVSRIANGVNKNKIEIPKIKKLKHIEYDDEYLDNSNEEYSYDNEYLSKNEEKNKKTYKYNQKFKNLYATNIQNNKADKHNINKTKNNNATKKHHTFYAVDNNDDDIIDFDAMNENDVDYQQSLLKERQIKAKDVGAQYPVRRGKSTYNTQYLPPNISQVAYDKNNKHLPPAIFESHIINQVIDSLGGENAVQLAKALIDKVGKIDIADDDGNTLLMHAVARHNQSLIAMLLSEGANPNLLNNDGFSPLHLAASNGDDVAIYSLMMGGGNPNLMDKDGNTSLMYASKMCNEQSIKVMMALGGDPSIINKSTGKTAIDFAGENENPYILPLLEVKTKQLKQRNSPVNLTKELL